ncbi:MAG TPA: SDR family oxidoreductase, partial [Dehalococcoidia bacterium]|nr:SDR family oxidoreductase [Dehalococcoidia bacterium]
MGSAWISCPNRRVNYGTVFAATGEEIRRRTPAGRWGRPDDLVAIAVLLASPASDFISGACIPVDGG